MTDQWAPVDFSPLDPTRDPKWAARVEATRRAAAAIVERRTMAQGPLDIVNGWARPILAAAAVLLVLLGGADALLHGSAGRPAIVWARRAASVCSPRRRSPMVARRQAPSCAASWESRGDERPRAGPPSSCVGRVPGRRRRRMGSRRGGGRDRLVGPPRRRRDAGPTDEDEPFDDDAEEDLLKTLGLSRAQLDSVDHLLDRREDRLEDDPKSRLPDLQVIGTRAARRSVPCWPPSSESRTTDGSARSRA